MNETIVTKNVFKKSISKKLEWDINVPDLKKDVLKILSSQTECVMTDCTFVKNSWNITIEAISDILYIPEETSDENICFLKARETFSFKADMPADLSWKQEDIDIKCINEPSVLINSRKVGIRATAIITVSLYDNCRFLMPEEKEDIEFDKKNICLSAIHSVTSEKIGISPTFSLPSGKAGISEIIRCNVKLLNKELKPITNKAVFKGNMAINLFYMSDLNTLECVEFVSPFTEIIDINGLNDEMNLIYSALPKKINAEMIIGDDSLGKGINVDGIIELKIKAYTNCNSEYVCDAYSPKFKEEIEKENMNYVCLSECFCDSYALKEILEFEDTEIVEVYFVDADVVTRNAQIRDGRITVSSSLVCNVIFRTQSGIRCENKSINFDFSQVISSAMNYDDAQNIEIMCEPENLSYVISGQNMLEIRCNILYTSHFSSQKEVCCVTSVKTDRDSKKSLLRAPVVAYFPQSDEPVFNVAKKFLSTPDKIRNLNEISDGICKKGSCIIIE